MQAEELIIKTITEETETNLAIVKGIELMEFRFVLSYISRYINEYVPTKFHKTSDNNKIQSKDKIEAQIDITKQLVIDKVVEVYYMIIHNKQYINKGFVIKCNDAVFSVLNQKNKRILFLFNKTYMINPEIFKPLGLGQLKKLSLKENKISNIEWIINIFNENLDYISLSNNNIYNIRTLKRIVNYPKKSRLIINLSSNPLSKITYLPEKCNDEERRNGYDHIINAGRKGEDGEKFIKNHKCNILNYILDHDAKTNSGCNADYDSNCDSNSANYNDCYSNNSSDDSFDGGSRRSFGGINKETQQHKYRLFLNYYNKIGARISI